MRTARITTIEFVSPPQVKMEEFADLFADRPGGHHVVEVIGNSAIESKGMAVNPVIDDPSDWGTTRRMDVSLAEARALGREAIGRALDRSGLSPGEIGLLATATTTTHSAPGLDTLVHETGMLPGTEFQSLGPMGCYAALPALSTVRNWVEVHGRPAVLLLVDLFSPHLQAPPYDREQAVVLTLFGDGAAAAVVRPGEAALHGLDILDTEMLYVPEFAEDLQVHVGESGVRIRLAPTMPDITASAVAGPTDRLLTRNGLRRADIHWFALHPGGRRIIDRVAEELDLPADSTDVARAVMREYGNTAGPAVMAVLGRLQESRPLSPGQYGVALTFGPGATIWSVLLGGA
ncbi:MULTISPECIES: type III polyketide synthase [Thermomonosporaceae]|uniref:type III polyketide synthase n=1 Tax=Thermomonosporaceae TaxID=2012 RepID=UPI00255AC62F|nr:MULTISPECIES: 3-oxoacyl-[acyl-carrier-protein] synthase III C-terminal domain-containing protein [Thermomonosporaceae]MDL4774227.1 3-oxoacyl-[acyl-carrier-protein] synthase III C-terminal domain-containing protein [Actinomadura xylanilytica]